MYDACVEKEIFSKPFNGSCLLLVVTGYLLSWSPIISICINDPPNVINNSKVYMYVDDTCINLQADNISDLNEALNKDLDALYAWLNGNRLSLKVARLSQ